MSTLPKAPPEDTLITAYVTRYAGTGEILRVRGRISQIVADPFLTFRHPGAPFDVYISRKDWFPTLEEAQADAAKRVKRKLASLDKQRAALLKRIEGGVEVKDLTGGHP